VPKFQTRERASHRREPHVLYALGLTLPSGPNFRSARQFRDLPCRLRLPGDQVLSSAKKQCFVAPFLNLADSRPGQIQRASNYTAENRLIKRFSEYFCRNDARHREASRIAAAIAPQAVLLQSEITQFNLI